MKRKTKSTNFILSTIGQADIAPNIPTALSGAVERNIFEHSTTMKLEIVEQLKYNQREVEWQGSARDLSNGNLIELTIGVSNSTECIERKMDLLNDFFNNYENTMTTLYNYIYERYLNTNFSKPLEEIKSMYFLSAVNLKTDSINWWIVLEPHYNVESIYDHFLRFTIVDKKIIWSNI